MLWTQLLAEVINVEVLERLSAEHPDVRYAHGFLIQQLVEGGRPVGEIAENLGVTSQAVSKTVRIADVRVLGAQALQHLNVDDLGQELRPEHEVPVP